MAQNPASGELASLNLGMPGVVFGRPPPPRNLGQAGGIAMPGQTWGPGNGGRFPIDQRSGIPQGMTTVRGKRSDVDVVHQHIMHPFPDGSHLYVTEGQIAWAARAMDPVHGTSMITTLPRLNKFLADNWAVYQDLVVARDPAALAFQQTLAFEGEEKLWQYNNYSKRGQRGLDFLALMPGYDAASVESPIEGEDPLSLLPVREFYQRSMEKVFRNVTLFGIINHWGNPLGAVKVITPGSILETPTYHSKETEINVANISISGAVKLSNIFGNANNTCAGAKTYLILRRKLMGDGEYGAYEIVPYASRKRLDQPPDDEVLYRDESGRLVRGIVWTMGTVREPSQKVTNRATRDWATGLNVDATPKGARDATGALGDMRILMDIQF